MNKKEGNNMKLFALTCGRKMGNCEILIKEALMGAEELGVDVEIVRLLDLDIRHCRICWPAPCLMKGPKACVIKDDALFLREKIMDCDGLIIAAPVYTLTPPGYLLAIRDRILGPRVDVASFMEAKKTQGTDVRFEQKMFIDDRIFQKRVGAFISVGGAPLANWVSLGIPLLHTLTFSLGVEIVDQIQILGVAEDGAIVLQDEALKRARRLGFRVAEAMKKSLEEVKYRGEERATCPVCHTNLMVVGGDSPIECAVCGIKGNIRVTDGKITVDFSAKEQKKSRLKIEGKRIHHFEVLDVAKALEPHNNQIPAKVKKYKSYKSPTLPPSKIGKKSRTLT
jgi:multimeric flavodoxin WrbA